MTPQDLEYTLDVTIDTHGQGVRTALIMVRSEVRSVAYSDERGRMVCARGVTADEVVSLLRSAGYHGAERALNPAELVAADVAGLIGASLESGAEQRADYDPALADALLLRCDDSREEEVGVVRYWATEPDGRRWRIVLTDAEHGW